MAFAASAKQITSLPSRYFWHRLIACLIDLVIFHIICGLVFFALSAVTPWDLTLPFLQKLQCQPIGSNPLIQKIESDWPLQSGEV